MVVTDRKDGRLRRTVDLQRLNAQCLRETHHCESPFTLAMQVPANTIKAVFDATYGYHSVELNGGSRPLTAFITPWVPTYLRIEDAYTRRYDEIIKDKAK